jgi:hypothetical protein
VSHRYTTKRNAKIRPRFGAGLAVLTAIAIAAVIPAAALGWLHHHAEPAAAAAAADVLGRPQPHAGLRLLSFLATVPDTAAGASRGQAVEVVSLATQYGGNGLTAEIVDESGAGRDTLINTYYDWDLGAVLLTADPGRALAARYDVARVPATLLIDRDGNVVARWSSNMLTAQAAQAITGKLS